MADLDLPSLPPAARVAHLFPALKGQSLLSVGQLCDAGCNAHFTATAVTIDHQGTTVLTGQRDPTSRLWVVTTTDDTAPNHALLVNQTTKPAELVAFAHAALFSPALSTLQTALDKNYLTNFPGLTSNTLRRHPPQSSAMIKGHLDQKRKNQRPTPKPTVDLPLLPIDDDNDDEADDPFPASESPSEVTHFCYAACVPAEPRGQVFTDQTGRFLLPASTGNTQLFVLYDYDSNSIHVEPMPSKSGAAILKAYKTVHNRLVHAGLRPQLQRLDNECSAALKEFLRNENVEFQLVPPGVHRANAAERAIRTFKNHFIAGLCSTDPDFPIHLWDRLLDQAVLTLNLLRGSRINPKLSAWAQVYGQYDFNRTPIAPPGTRVLVHVKPDQRATWSPHADDGWYIGPAWDHYRCYRVYMKDTARERTPDTVTWFPQHVKMPVASSAELIVAAAHDILHALQHPSPGSALAPLTDSERGALTSITAILLNRDPDAPASPPPATATAPVLRVATSPKPPHKGRFTDPIVAAVCPPPLPTPAPTAPPSTVHATTASPTTEIAPSPWEPTPTTLSTSTGHAPPSSTPAAEPTPTDPAQQPATWTTVTRKSNRGSNAKQTTMALAPALPPAPPAPATVLRVPSPPPTVTPAAPPTADTVLRVPPRAPNPQPATETPQKSRRSNRRRSPPRRTNHHRQPIRRGNRNRRPSRKQREAFETALAAMACPDCCPDPDTTLRDDITHAAHAAVNVDTGELAEYQTLLKSSDGPLWERSCTEEIARLAQGFPPGGIPATEGTDTIRFIKVGDIPEGRKATYLRICLTDRPQKEQTRRLRFTVGGDRVDYPGEVSTKTASLATAKMLFNSVVSTPGAKFMTMDIKDFYLCTPMDRYEYMRIRVDDIPKDIFEFYNLQDLVHNGYVYCEIRRGMYGLPQAGRIANDELVPHLAAHGYIQAEHTPGLFTHESRPISFTLVVDDFGVKYVGKEHAEHLRDVIASKYKMTTDWSGELYLGIQLKWDYDKRTVDLSMPTYISKCLQRFDHPTPKSPQHSPHAWTKPQYGAVTQLTAPFDDSPPLTKEGTNRIQQIVGVLLYYARAIDSSMLPALGTIAATQSNATEKTERATRQLLDYAATHPDATIRFCASDMVLHIHSDASYLSEPKARSRAGGLFFLSNRTGKPTPTSTPPPTNGAVHVNSNIMRVVTSSAAEAEIGALFFNGQDGCMIRTTLTELGHPQPVTTIQTDNECANGIANDTVKQKRSKAIDMRFYWIRDRVRQGQFNVHWRKGTDNLADYFTKHHPPATHLSLRPTYLLPSTS